MHYSVDHNPATCKCVCVCESDHLTSIIASPCDLQCGHLTSYWLISFRYFATFWCVPTVFHLKKCLKDLLNQCPLHFLCNLQSCLSLFAVLIVAWVYCVSYTFYCVAINLSPLAGRSLALPLSLSDRDYYQKSRMGCCHINGTSCLAPSATGCGLPSIWGSHWRIAGPWTSVITDGAGCQLASWGSCGTTFQR